MMTTPPSISLIVSTQGPWLPTLSYTIDKSITTIQSGLWPTSWHIDVYLKKVSCSFGDPGRPTLVKLWAGRAGRLFTNMSVSVLPFCSGNYWKLSLAKYIRVHPSHPALKKWRFWIGLTLRPDTAFSTVVLSHRQLLDSTTMCIYPWQKSFSTVIFNATPWPPLWIMADYGRQ